MGEDTWIKQNLWTAAFKKFEVIWSAKADHCHFKFLKTHSQILFDLFLNTLTQIKFLQITL